MSERQVYQVTRMYSVAEIHFVLAESEEDANARFDAGCGEKYKEYDGDYEGPNLTEEWGTLEDFSCHMGSDWEDDLVESWENYSCKRKRRA